MKSIGKKSLIVFLSLLAIVLLIWVGSAGYSAWQGYKWQKQTDAFQTALSKPYREDTYGGKTPEETWGMFLEALKKGDVELASRYFVVEKQEEWKETIQRTLDAGKLNLTIKNLSSKIIKESSTTDKAYFYYDINDGSGRDVRNSLVFTFNPYSKIWKISVL